MKAITEKRLLRELEKKAGWGEEYGDYEAVFALRLLGLYGGEHTVLFAEEGLEALEELKALRLPRRNRLHCLASFLLVAVPSGTVLLTPEGPVDDDRFYFAALLGDAPRTFGRALEEGEVYVSFPGDRGW
ncbi:hypothetical protein [Thermus sp.]|uniref:hypothetical protein n=1 Tax=Thermus sp. TaxID=275 RepID=UPI003D15296D